MESNLYDALKPFAARAGQIRLFDLLLLDILPPNLHARLRVLNVRDGILVIGVDHAALATQARFQAPLWLDQLNRAGQKEGNLPLLSKIEVRIFTDERLLKPSEKKQRTLGETARASLRALADHEPNSALAQVLRRLANAGTKPVSNKNEA